MTEVERQEVTVGVVGANSPVGTEVSLLLREYGYKVVPIVRNSLATHFLSSQGFDCRIASITEPNDAKQALADIDAVVMVAFAWQFSPRKGFKPRKARETNENLITNAVRYSKKNSNIVYYSSIAAFGDELSTDRYSDWNLYTREKLNAEETLFTTCEQYQKDGFVLRLGQVFGPNQARTRRLADELKKYEVFHVNADPHQASNILHTVTLADATDQCIRSSVEAETYSVTNQPPWGWKKVFEYYQDGMTEIQYHGSRNSSDSSILRSLLQTGLSWAENHERRLRSLMIYFPERVNQRLFHEYFRRYKHREINQLYDEVCYSEPAFKFDLVPGQRISKLKDTAELLNRQNILTDIFDDEYV